MSTKETILTLSFLNPVWGRDIAAVFKKKKIDLNVESLNQRKKEFQFVLTIFLDNDDGNVTLTDLKVFAQPIIEALNSSGYELEDVCVDQYNAM